MAPATVLLQMRQAGPVIQNPSPNNWNWRAVAKDEDLILESWSQGFVVGALMLMGCITIANMRRRITLHKLIFLEQAMALSHGTFCFLDFDGYGWYLSSTAALLYLSYILHNIVAWMKVKPFFHGKSTIFEPKFVKWTTRIYTYSLAATVPPVLFQITDNFRYFNGYGGWYTRVRPYEPLMRDPWWVFCCGVLFYVISKSYGMGVFKVIKKSPRFGILFVSIILALFFTVLDIVASLHPFIGDTDGINPFWKLSLVFKCLTDAILLDDFKTELKRLGLKRMKRDEKRRESHALTLDDNERMDSDDEAAANYSNGTANGYYRTHAYRPSVSYAKSKTDSGNLEQSEEVEFMQALQTQPSQLSSDRESRRSSGHRPQVGRGGQPATRLPRMFAAIKPGRKSKRSADEEAARNDSVWTADTEEGTEKPSRPKKRDALDDFVAPEGITCEDDALAQARREQQRTIAELTQRKHSAGQAKRMSLSSNGSSSPRGRKPSALPPQGLGDPRPGTTALEEHWTSSNANPFGGDSISSSSRSPRSRSPARRVPSSTDLAPTSSKREDSPKRVPSPAIEEKETSPPTPTATVQEKQNSTLPNSKPATRKRTQGSISTGQNVADLIKEHKKRGGGRDFWDGVDEMGSGPKTPRS